MKKMLLVVILLIMAGVLSACATSEMPDTPVTADTQPATVSPEGEWNGIAHTVEPTQAVRAEQWEYYVTWRSFGGVQHVELCERYETLIPAFGENIEHMNNMASHGWELLTVSEVPNPGGNAVVFYLFWRRLRS